MLLCKLYLLTEAGLILKQIGFWLGVNLQALPSQSFNVTRNRKMKYFLTHLSQPPSSQGLELHPAGP